MTLKELKKIMRTWPKEYDNLDITKLDLNYRHVGLDVYVKSEGNNHFLVINGVYYVKPSEQK